jgi:hypothetical protein
MEGRESIRRIEQGLPLAPLFIAVQGFAGGCSVSARTGGEIWVSKPTSLAVSDAATPAMTEDNVLPFSLPSVQRKKITAAFDGSRISPTAA